MSEFPNHPNFKILQKLGQGAFGAAYKVLNKEDNSVYVIKKILLKDAKEDEIKKIENEANILASFDSENIVKYYNSFSDNDSFNIIMEYCDGLDLRKYINEHKTSNDFIKKDIINHIIFEICLGLKEIHSKNLIHRDLKPDNIFLNADMKVKIGDFGIAKQLKSQNEYAKTQTGTLAYMAPEIINEGKYNNKVDIWALGCIIQELCTLNFCFQGQPINILLNQITKGNPEKINTDIYGDDFQNLIDLLLNKNYKKRPNIDEVIKLVKRNIDIDKTNFQKIEEQFLEDKVYQNYLIERNILNSIDQVENTIFAKVQKFNKIKHWGFGVLLTLPLSIASTYLFGGLPMILRLAIGYGLGYGTSVLEDKLLAPEEKIEFLFINKIIISKIQAKLTNIIKERLDSNNNYI